MASAANEAATALLTPSQTIRSQNDDNTTTSVNPGSAGANNRKWGNGGRKKKKNNNNNNANTETNNNPNVKSQNAAPADDQITAQAANEGNGDGNKTATNKRRNRRKPKQPPTTVIPDGNSKNNASGNKDQARQKKTNQNQNKNGDTTTLTHSNNENNQQNTTTKKKRGRGKRYPWRKHIPPGTLDPITLDPLVSKSYAPFALKASAPYVPVPLWPPEEDVNKQTQQLDPEEQRKERERKLLQEQWGNKVLHAAGERNPEVCEDHGDDSKPAPSNEQKNFYNLFDGRALAYYMVSQLQFIDPLNRRDLTRDELVSLDRYLRRHNFYDINVVEAYDTKGVSLSTAGAASTTAAGRIEILQQEAQVLLNILFGGGALPPAAVPSRPHRENRIQDNALNMQYSAYQASQQQQQQRQHLELHGITSTLNDDDPGIYGDEAGGVLVIDDDLNPSLRGHNLQQASAPTSLWSANRITSSHGHAAALQEHNFPALTTTVAVPAQDSSLSSAAPEFRPLEETAPVRAPGPALASTHTTNKKPPSSSLKLIGKAVKKTNPEEQQRQWEAREAARKRAMLSNLTFGSNPVSDSVPGATGIINSLPPVTMDDSGTTQAQLDRNRNLAEAMGVAPATGNFQFNGWARPTRPPANGVDEFAADLYATYPDSLIIQAREHIAALVKVEKKWKNFLEDDKAASLPLNKMDRPLRKLVHEYAVFWKLKTESFDPEPKRYVQAYKLLDTSAPYPLLSDAARNWSGPTGAGAVSEHTSLQAAGQSTRSLVPDFSTLPIRPKSSMVAELPASNAVKDPLPQNLRFASLGAGKERPKLELQARTIPLELPPFEPPKDDTEGADELLRRRQERLEQQKRKQLEKDQRRQLVLQAAFASDSEDEEVGVAGGDSGSDWGSAPEEVFPGSDDEN